MPVQVYWIDEDKTIVRYDFHGAWTWDEFYPIYEQAIAMEKSVPHRVDVIVDMRNAAGVPANALTHVKSISDKQPANLGVSVIVTSNRFVLALYNIGVKFYSKIGYYFRAAATVDEALAMIASARAERPKTVTGV